MIEIIEVGEALDDTDSNTGTAESNSMEYYIVIGHTFITNFTHRRADGLAICFDKAAEAVRKIERPQ